MTLSIRRGAPADAPVAGDICYRAFKAIAEEHNFIPDFPSSQAGVGAVGFLIGHPKTFDVVAEIDGRIVGSNFLDERNPISGVGPVSVDPDLQNDGAGRALMQAVMDRSAEQGFAGIRLLQAGYHRRSLALYSKLGFDVREYVACLQGPVIGKTMPGYAVRPATAEDATACNALCLQVHGHHRGGELAEATQQGLARVVERGGRITGYATRIAYFSHAVAETNDDLKALISAAESFDGPGFLVPTRNGELMRWCLDQDLRVAQTATLMTIGLYNEPRGAWMPSIIY